MLYCENHPIPQSSIHVVSRISFLIELYATKLNNMNIKKIKILYRPNAAVNNMNTKKDIMSINKLHNVNLPLNRKKIPRTADIIIPKHKNAKYSLFSTTGFDTE